MNLIDLPSFVLIEILEYLPYEELSKHRLVCRKFDQICQQLLNGGFNKAVRLHTIIFKRIKARLPRRESERRNHLYARHADILTSIETRISMLSMTYCKYIDLNLCCFIPGRVLDEIFRILRIVSKTYRPLRPHEVLQELRDISSMAIEHFDEKIATTFKSYIDSSTRTHSTSIKPMALSSSMSGYNWSSASTSSTEWLPIDPSTTCSNVRLDDLLFNLGQSGIKNSTKEQTGGSLISGSSLVLNAQQECPGARANMTNLKKLELMYKRGISKVRRMQKIQIRQSRHLQQALMSVSDLTTQMTELRKRLEDVDAKNREISANIKQINIGEAPAATTVAVTISPSTAISQTSIITDSGATSVGKKRTYESSINTQKDDGGKKLKL